MRAMSRPLRPLASPLGSALGSSLFGTTRTLRFEGPQERARLDGLEVSDSSWDEWVLVQRQVQGRREPHESPSVQ